MTATTQQPRTTNNDLYQKVNDRIISMLERGVIPWRMQTSLKWQAHSLTTLPHSQTLSKYDVA